MIHVNRIGRALFAAAVVGFAVGTAQAGLVLEWQFQEATAELGQDGSVILSEDGVTEWLAAESQWATMANVKETDLGTASAELQIWEQVDARGAWTIDISTALDMNVNEDPGGAINFAKGYTYFQLAVYVSDVPYEFNLDYELDDPSAPFIEQHDHFVNQYGGGAALEPQDDPYVLLWGGVDYTTSGFDFSGWGYVCAHAETNATLSIVPIPEPATLALAGLAGAVACRRR
jgi:hypothetical protein